MSDLIPLSNFFPSLSMAFIVNISSNTTLETVVAMMDPQFAASPTRGLESGPSLITSKRGLGIDSDCSSRP
jgi:hypothetical protein